MADTLADFSSPSDDDSTNLHIMSNYNEVNRYELKYKRFKKVIKDTIFENAALCDEISRINEQIVKFKEERRFLLKKLFHFQSLHEPGTQASSKANVSPNATPSTNASSNTNPPTNIKLSNEAQETSKPKRKVIPKKNAKDLIESSLKASNKRKRTGTPAKRHAQLVPLDVTGRPIFPIELGALTVHSLGEIATDRVSFHSDDYIYPVGFCSTRVYASTKNPEVKCMYTCKISDDGNEPKFEIAADDDPEHPYVAIGLSAGECHIKLLKAVNAYRQMDETLSSDRGAKFFGFSHPTIQNLIQGCPGARKCVNYKWVKFEVCKYDQTGEMAYCMSDSDATISFDALQRTLHRGTNPGVINSYDSTPKTSLSSQESGESPNLRVLLTNKSPVSLQAKGFQE